MKTVFFGASRFVLETIALLQSDFNLQLVVTTEENPQDAVPAFCQKNHISCFALSKIDKDSLEQMRKIHADLGVLSYFGILLPKELLHVFPKGILNIHPSLLPKYRGATPVQSAILNGEEKTGVSIMLLDDQMDHGPLLSQAEETITDADTTISLYERLFHKGTALLKEVMPEYLNGHLVPVAQDDTKATYTKRSFSRQDGFIDLKNPLGSQLDRMVRALYPWPGVWTMLTVNNKPIRIKILPQGMLQAEGKKPITIRDFINGYPEYGNVIKGLFGRED